MNRIGNQFSMGIVRRDEVAGFCGFSFIESFFWVYSAWAEFLEAILQKLQFKENFFQFVVQFIVARIEVRVGENFLLSFLQKVIKCMKLAAKNAL